jgi:hypothetical protein
VPDKKRRPERETPHKDRICKTCGRTFAWRREWEKDWDVVKHCSDACRGYKPGEADAALEAAILELLAELGEIGPAEAAKLVGGTEARRDWEGLLVPAKTVARRLAAAGKVVIVQHGRVVDGAMAKGAIRLRLR